MAFDALSPIPRDAAADAVIARACLRIRALGLQVDEVRDFRAWVRELGAAPGTTAVSQAFDPDYCDLERARWLRLHDRGALLGTIAGKALRGDMLALHRSGELWFGRWAAEFGPLDVDFPASIPDIRGDVGYFGALWLHPDLRGSGLAGVMARLIRATAMRHWDLDWLCGGVLEALAKREVPTRVYGYAHCERISRPVRFPVTGRVETLYMPWESREEWLRSSLAYAGSETVEARQAQ